MKKILMFKRSQLCYGSVNYFSEQIALKLRQHGYECDFLDITGDGNRIASDLKKLLSGNRYSAALAVNAIGQESYEAEDGNLWDALGIPFFNLLLDHPGAHLSDLQKGCRNYHVLCIDREHVRFIKQHLPHICDAHFLPLGGIEGPCFDESAELFAARENAIVFCGENKRLDRIEKEILSLEGLGRDLVVEQIEAFLNERQRSLDSILEDILRDRKITPSSEEEYLPYAVTMVPAQRYCAAYLREELIRHLAASGISLCIYGSGWEDIIAEEGGRIILHKEVPFTETAGLYQNSRIVLNVMPLFRDGSHDRVPTALLNGAAALTDPTAFLKELFPAGQGVYYYDPSAPEKLPEMIEDMLAEPYALYESVSRGRKIAKEKLSWESFSEQLLKILNEF